MAKTKYSVTRYNKTRYHALTADGELLAVTVYRKGALNIINHINTIMAKNHNHTVKAVDPNGTTVRIMLNSNGELEICTSLRGEFKTEQVLPSGAQLLTNGSYTPVDGKHAKLLKRMLEKQQDTTPEVEPEEAKSFIDSHIIIGSPGHGAAPEEAPAAEPVEEAPKSEPTAETLTTGQKEVIDRLIPIALNFSDKADEAFTVEYLDGHETEVLAELEALGLVAKLNWKPGSTDTYIFTDEGLKLIAPHLPKDEEEEEEAAIAEATDEEEADIQHFIELEQQDAGQEQKAPAAEPVEEPAPAPKPARAKACQYMMPGDTEPRNVEPDTKAVPGMTLIRKHKGKTVIVKVLENGFEWEGTVYPTLTHVSWKAADYHISGKAADGCKAAWPTLQGLPARASRRGAAARQRLLRTGREPPQEVSHDP